MQCLHTPAIMSKSLNIYCYTFQFTTADGISKFRWDAPKTRVGHDWKLRPIQLSLFLAWRGGWVRLQMRKSCDVPKISSPNVRLYDPAETDNTDSSTTSHNRLFSVCRAFNVDTCIRSVSYQFDVRVTWRFASEFSYCNTCRDFHNKLLECRDILWRFL